MTRNWPISPDLQLFQSFSTKVAQNDSEWPIWLICNFFNLFPPKWLRMTRNGQFHPICKFQSFPTKVAQNDSEWPILPNLQLFQSFPTEVAQNDSEWPILPDLQLLPLKWLRMTRNGQIHPIRNFSNLFHQSGSE